jgi:hypothetical protein
MNAVLRQFMTAQRGNAAAVKEEYTVAVTPGTKALNEYMDALNHLGQIRLQHGDLEGASKYFEESVNFYRANAGLNRDQTSASDHTKAQSAKRKTAG